MTKREVLIARSAYRKACVLFNDGWRGAEAAAAKVYPLPKVTRPRVVRDHEQGDYEWAVIDGILRFRSNTLNDVRPWVIPGRGNGWDLVVPTPERIALWADLLANPTEEVEADA